MNMNEMTQKRREQSGRTLDNNTSAPRLKLGLVHSNPML